MRAVLLFVLLLTLLLPAVAAPPATDLEARRKALNDLLGEQWEYTLKTNPEYATILGDKRYNDQLADVSLKFVLADLEMSRKFLARFEAIDTAGFPEQEKLSKALMVRDLKQQLDFAVFKEWEMPVNQMGGPHLGMPQLVALLPFTNVKDYEDYISRLRRFSKVLDDTMDNMRRGMADHLMPPRFLLEKVVTQSENIVTADVAKSPFAQPLAKFPDSISEADRKRLQMPRSPPSANQLIPHTLSSPSSSAKTMPQKAAPRPASGLCPMAAPTMQPESSAAPPPI